MVDRAGRRSGPRYIRPARDTESARDDVNTQPFQRVAFDPATRRLHRRLSAAAERFLDYVERHPEAAERSRYQVLDSDRRGVGRQLQAWPLFLDRQADDRCAEAMVGLARLIRAVPHRVFDGRLDRLAAWYGLDPSDARPLARLLADPEHLGRIVARGDFIDTEEGLACLEVNVAANLGGWTTGLWERLYLQAPPIRAFVRGEGLELVGVDPLETFFTHLVEVAAATGSDGEVNIAVAVPPGERGSEALSAYGAERYRSFLRTRDGLEGELHLCGYDDLDVVGDRRVELSGRRIHVLVECYAGLVPPRIFTPWMLGGLVVLNGPVSRLLNDRRTLALLSEHAESDLLTAPERDVVRRHLPWTRVVADGAVDFRGRRSRLPDLLVEERSAMVLKRTGSMAGAGIVVGATADPARWRSVVDEALAAGDWIVQERVASLPYHFQTGDAGCAPHDVIWGLFAFGDRYGGGYLRLMPQGGSGVVNAAQGADHGLYLVVDSYD